MIEKFNFYDIYGYFLPGLAFLGILWLPFGVVGHSWPPSSWSSAIAVAAFAYILGHLLQTIGTRDLPSKVKDSKGELRNPSEKALDENHELPTVLRQKIASTFEKQFGLDLAVDQEADDEIDKRRNVAFLLARQVLIREKTASYAEQFQGMYALARGMVIVFAVACAYWLGWAAGIVQNAVPLRAAVVLLTVAMLVAINVSILLVHGRVPPKGGREPGWWTFLKRLCPWSLLAGFLSAGYIASVKYNVTSSACAVLALLAAVALLGSLRTFGAYKFFAERFATTVWRDFLAYHAKLAEASAAEKKDAPV